ncbi:alpha/beta fold hydrolase [Phytohabitans sp. ZYX-F-186]|uniref:Alpha/beta fold hydrolase n=1 Tax=Phytohabitans maris TaxID=3071409 RepID=A0ABU0ZQW6_9ACTN|nr:alpha/beta fold hydrolase [Phytohabitans sp. ZYX-F-186]MDQ7909353.1 alpha/beta fold hydrolase [Phytohabitans sp. ZYX-F-186]
MTVAPFEVHVEDAVLDDLRDRPSRTRPTAHGGSPADAFHVVAPSMPGYGWSGPTTRRGWHAGRIGGAWLHLMAALGYERFGAHGTDWGSVVSTEIARQRPDRVTGLHLTLLVSGLRPRDGRVTPEEEAQLSANAGHFAALELPELLVADLRAFFTGL